MLQFPGVYDEMREMYAARPSNIGKRRSRATYACTGPITYVGHERVQADIDNLRHALQAAGRSMDDGFLTALSPTNVVLHYRNEYYRSDEEYLSAVADAMHHEYAAIVDAGFTLQIDDPRLATYYDRTPSASWKTAAGLSRRPWRSSTTRCASCPRTACASTPATAPMSPRA